MRRGASLVSVLFRLCLAAILLLLVLILIPLEAGHRPRPGGSCISNLKQLALATFMYEADENLTPPRDVWMDAIVPYHKNPYIEKCSILLKKKQQGYGYAFNSLLEKKLLSKVKDPETEPMIYDSINYGRNASDPKTSLPNPGRHGEKNVIAYADGHAASVKS